MKEEQSKYRRRVLANGLGPPPDPPKFTEAMMAAMEIMGQELSMNDIPFVSVTMPNTEKDDHSPFATTGIVMKLGNLLYSTYHVMQRYCVIMIEKVFYVNQYSLIGYNPNAIICYYM